MGSNEALLEESVPVVDISSVISSNTADKLDLSSPSAVKTVEEIRNACQQWGFFYIIGHQVDPLLIDEIRKVSKDFFHAPKEFKNTVRRTTNNYRGYSDSELTKQRKDWKELFDFGAEERRDPGGLLSKIDLDAGKNQWPEGMDHFKDVLTKYYSTMHYLSTQLVDLIFVSLGLDPEPMRHHFIEANDTSFCRLNYYAPYQESTELLGVGPHTDSGVLTILLQDDGVPSLQVEKDGRFHSVRPIPGSFVINIGDMMQVWSNGYFKAPVHRVLTSSNKERFSVPFFLNPSYESNVEPLHTCVSNERPVRYHPINWGHFRRGRILGDYADFGEEIQISQFETKK